MTDRVRKPEWLKINIGANEPNESTGSFTLILKVVVLPE